MAAGPDNGLRVQRGINMRQKRPLRAAGATALSRRARVAAVLEVPQMRQHGVRVAGLNKLQRRLAVVPCNRRMAKPDDHPVGVPDELLCGGQNADRRLQTLLHGGRDWPLGKYISIRVRQPGNICERQMQPMAHSLRRNEVSFSNIRQ